jgi:hypothetical protein
VNYLLDTCILSELLKDKPDTSVVRWLASVAEEACTISVLTIGEFQKGIAKLGDTKRAARLRAWVETDLADRFTGRVLDVDTAIAAIWGALCGEAERHGRKLPVIDSLIAATAQRHRLTVVTRDDSYMKAASVPTINPWA